MMRRIRKPAALVATLMALLLPEFGEAASVKPLEVFTERIVVLEVEQFANEHSVSAALVRRSIDRLNKKMNIMSQERVVESLKLIADARQALSDAERTASALSDYVNKVRPQLKEGGHDRFLPLAGFYKEIEKPYHAVLDRFLSTAGDFVQYCSENHVAISTGQKMENSRYDALYGAYLRDMEEFNLQSVKRSQLIADWSEEYPRIIELLPR